MNALSRVFCGALSSSASVPCTQVPARRASQRHWYADSSTETPLTDAFNNYASWFAQFGVGKESREELVQSFLLEDTLDDSRDVRMFASSTPPLIQTEAVDFKEYLEAQLSFVRSRNKRIFEWCLDYDVPAVGG